MSKQKQLIFDIVMSTMSHPTADWVYHRARQKMPRISLGTVYRNLKALTDEGLILEIVASKGLSRYDANTARHSHLRCTACDRLEDLPLGDIAVTPRSRRLKNYKIIDYRVELLGLCPECQKQHSSIH